MKTPHSYFRLFANCIPVKGAKRSAVCDLQKNTIQLIPNDLYTILTNYQDCTYEEIMGAYDQDETLDEYFNFLTDQALGFWTTSPSLFPDLDLTWQAPTLVYNAIIDIDSESSHNLEAIFAQLDDLGCQHVQLRYYTSISQVALAQHLAPIKHSRLNSVELLLEYQSQEMIQFLFENYPRIYRIVVYNSPQTGSQTITTSSGQSLLGEVIHLTHEVTSADHCGAIDPYFFAIDTKTFTEAQQFNTCLNGKIGIDARGEIKNCPSLETSFGNVSHTSLHQALLKKDFKTLWHINKDQVDTCKDCEFRYICTDCRAFIQNPTDIYSKPSKCQYDPYTATWASTASSFAP